jgi:hypothetical protein
MGPFQNSVQVSFRKLMVGTVARDMAGTMGTSGGTGIAALVMIMAIIHTAMARHLSLASALVILIVTTTAITI